MGILSERRREDSIKSISYVVKYLTYCFMDRRHRRNIPLHLCTARRCSFATEPQRRRIKPGNSDRDFADEAQVLEHAAGVGEGGCSATAWLGNQSRILLRQGDGAAADEEHAVELGTQAPAGGGSRRGGAREPVAWPRAPGPRHPDPGRRAGPCPSAPPARRCARR